MNLEKALEQELRALVYEGFALNAQSTPEQSQAWLRRYAQALDIHGGDRLGEIIDAVGPEYEAKTGLCCWCGKLPHDQEDF